MRQVREKPMLYFFGEYLPSVEEDSRTHDDNDERGFYNIIFKYYIHCVIYFIHFNCTFTFLKGIQVKT